VKAEADDQQNTPGKRTRNPVKLFQSPAEIDKTLTKLARTPPTPSTAKEETKLLYKKNSFLALRGDDGKDLSVAQFYQSVTLRH
jgi:hypothetical protein